MEYFKNETLCTRVTQASNLDFNNTTSFKIDTENIELGIKKL